MQTVLSNDEKPRLNATRRLSGLDSPREESFDRLVRMAARLIDAPVAFVRLIEDRRHWVKAAVGLDFAQIDQGLSFCNETLQGREVLEVENSADDPRFWDHPLVQVADGVRFYAGAPLIARGGAALGTIGVFDYEPRVLTGEERLTLQDLASLVVDELELREKNSRLEEEIAQRKFAEAALEKAKAESRARNDDLQESRQRLYALLDNAPAVIFLKDLDGRHLMVNRPFVSLLGMEQAEIIGKTDQELFPAEVAAAVRKHDQLVALTGTAEEFEETVLVRGKPHVFRSVKFPLRNADGVVHGVCGISTDVTERSTAQERLRVSDARKAAILEASLDGIITIAHDGTVLELNPAAERIFGYKPEEMLGKVMADVIVPERLRDAHQRHMERLLKTGDGPTLGHIFETSGRRADGTEFPMELALTRIPLEGPPMFTGHIRDISERKRAERALEDSRARFERMAANLPGMVFQLTMEDDGASAFTYVSQGCLELLGLPPQQLLRDSSSWEEAIHSTERSGFRLSISVSAKRLEPWIWEGRIHHPNGKVRWVRGFARPMRSRGNCTIWDGFVFDITDRKLAEEALVHSRDEAHRANRSKSEFLSRMSHELRTPLNAILGFGQLLERADLTPRHADSAHQITKAGRHLLNLINEVLDLARIEAGRISFSPEPVNASEVLREAELLLAPLANSRGIRIIRRSNREHWVTADRQRLSQVLLNLLSNAIKYNRLAGAVTVQLSEDDAYRLNISITDTGHGIPEEQLARVFTPFERLGAEDSEVEGSGIGLALSKRLMEMMGGSISVQSVENEGSTFALRIPIAEPPRQEVISPEVTPEVLTPKKVSTKQHTVVYVEDNPANVRLMARIMEQRDDIDLQICERGDTAVEVISTLQPSIIFLDLHLPGLNGEQVLSEVRANDATRDTPVVVISADAMPSQIRRLLAAGASSYLTKPIHIGEILRLVSEFLDSPKPICQ